jgi:hypothetical protein
VCSSVVDLMEFLVRIKLINFIYFCRAGYSLLWAESLISGHQTLDPDWIRIRIPDLVCRFFLALKLVSVPQVERIKERVEEKEGIPPPQQRLIFSGKHVFAYYFLKVYMVYIILQR